MKAKLLLLGFLLVVFPVAIPAQYRPDSIPNKPFKHAIGAALGLTTGYGLSYRYMPKRFGVQLAFAPNGNREYTNVSAGVTLLYRIVQAEKVNLFLYQGNHFLYSSGSGYYNYSYSEMYNGLGFGFEFTFLKRMSFNLMAGYAGYETFSRIGFTGETALFFKF